MPTAPALFAACALALIASCATSADRDAEAARALADARASSAESVEGEAVLGADAQRAALAALEAFRAAGERAQSGGYRLVPGDRVTVAVWEREDLTTQQVVGPDGYITLPVVGDVKLSGRTRTEALEAVRQRYSEAYPDLVVTLRVDEYTAYSVVVLGSVQTPGEQTFAAPPDLLQALGAAGGLLDAASGLQPGRCAVMRGGENVLWVDLDALLRQGDLSLNVPLIPGDVVHVTADAQRLFYVLGEVARPGIYPLRADSSILDAIAVAGGVTPEADTDDVRLLRPASDGVEDFNYKAYARGEFQFDRPLQRGDVVYVPERGLAEVGWIFRQLSPLAQILLFTEAVTDDN